MTKVKYEVWGRKKLGQGRRVRLAYALENEADAKAARDRLKAGGFGDALIVQRPPKYGRNSGLQ